MANWLKIEKWLRVAIVAGLFGLVFIIFSQKIEFSSVDLGRHLENGKIIWSNRQILFKNVYSYTEPNTIFVNHHWLTGVIYYAVYSLGGFKLLSLFNIVLILSAFALALKMAVKKSGFYIPALISIPVIFLLSERIEVRPEIFSYLFIILTWYILDAAGEAKNRRRLYWLLPLFILWSNIHIYFFIGLILCAIKIFSDFLGVALESKGEWRKRILAAWMSVKKALAYFGCLLLACSINPNFLRGLLYPFNILRSYGYEIAENKSIFYLEKLMVNGNIPLVKALLLLLALSFSVYLFHRIKVNYFNIFVALFFSFLALFAIRNISIFALVFLIIASVNISYSADYLKNNLSFAAGGLAARCQVFLASLVLIAVLGSAIYLYYDVKGMSRFLRGSFGWGLTQGSADSIEFFRKNNLSGPIFNNFDLGSALIFWLYPQEKVFVDNRPEAYSKEFFSEIYRPMQLDHDTWLKYAEKYQFKTIYFSHTDLTPWAQTFLSEIIDDSWSLVYFDRNTIIFLNKKNNDPEKVKNLALNNAAIRSRLRTLASNSDLHGQLKLASLASLIHQPDLASEIYQGILFENPDNAMVLSLLGGVYSGSSDRLVLMKAQDYIRRGIEAGYKLPGLHNQIGLIAWRLGNYQDAEAEWKQALKIDRKNTSALYYLEQIEDLRRRGELRFAN